MSGREGLVPMSQCIMDNGHMGTPVPMDRMTDKHLLKHYLPATSFAGGNNGKLTLKIHCQMDRFWKVKKIICCLSIIPFVSSS